VIDIILFLLDSEKMSNKKAHEKKKVGYFKKWGCDG
jgi:hypothetical protein